MSFMNGIGQANSIRTNSAKSSTAKNRSKSAQRQKPNGYAEMESLVKEICDGHGLSYFQWLHEQHQAFVIDFNLKNKGSIASLAKREGE
ncbi:hypothetical protein [Metasolibacillus fluoroglycofenilyticus]|uniref:hypothetical protein n=1 Tax=Metasolibacillus fluoroglycofenilyticus TaxID=1239396 RepID=UPI00128FDE8F|nr:hypothetical protein [Metasolibacillus fluoroglycofenilyticus]